MKYQLTPDAIQAAFAHHDNYVSAEAKREETEVALYDKSNRAFIFRDGKAHYYYFSSRKALPIIHSPDASIITSSREYYYAATSITRMVESFHHFFMIPEDCIFGDEEGCWGWMVIAEYGL